MVMKGREVGGWMRRKDRVEDNAEGKGNGGI